MAEIGGDRERGQQIGQTETGGVGAGHGIPLPALGCVSCGSAMLPFGAGPGSIWNM